MIGATYTFPTTFLALAFAAIIVWGCFMFLRWCWRKAVKALQDVERFNERIAAASRIMHYEPNEDSDG